MFGAADLDLLYADADRVQRAAAPEFRGWLDVADASPFDGVKVGDYQLRYPSSVALVKGESLVLPDVGLTLRVLDVSRGGDGAESLAVLVKAG